jgi:NAD(P)-dependent dehydrogenase (short-subunit alcohol dehydrogenase family)
MSRRFEGKHAVVTGAGSGIGLAIARRLASEGAEVSLFELDRSAGEAAAEAIRKEGGMAAAVPCDLGDGAAVGAAFAALSRLDILVNNAGIAHVGNVERTSPEDLDRIYRVNVKGVYHGLHFGVPKILAGGGGAIVNLASIASKVGVADRFAYSMSKGAVLAMTLSVARDYVGRGVRCNCVCPARIHTPFVDGYLARNYPDRRDEMFRQLSDYQPIGRMGTPEEVAAVVAFLCSEEASFITGSAYDIDGGVMGLR